MTAHRLSGSGMVSPLPERPDATLSALELHERVYWTAADGRGVDRLERRRQRRQRSGSERARFRGGGDCPAVIVGGGACLPSRRRVGVGVRVGIGFCLLIASPPSWKAASAPEKDRTISPRPGTGARAFSLRTSETPEGCETINSVGTLRPRAFARSSTCFGERRPSTTTSSRSRPSRLLKNWGKGRRVCLWRRIGIFGVWQLALGQA